MNLSDLQALYAGKIDKLFVGRLPPSIVSLLGLHTPEVYLGSSHVIVHIVVRHVQLADLLILPDMIRDGYILKARDTKPVKIIILYQHGNIRFKVVLKIACGGHEVWISTMHQTRPRQTRAILRRCDVLRRHK